MSMPFYSVSQDKGLSNLLKWETHPDFSRESVTLLAGSGSARKIAIGQPIALLAETGAATAAATAGAGNTGNGVLTMASPAVTGAVQEGVYTVTCTEPAANGGVFNVEDPDGVSIGTAKVGSAFTKQVRFTIADGAADFVAGDRFTIEVAKASLNPNSGKAVAWDPAGTDGSEVPWGFAAIAAEAPDGVDLTFGLVAIRRHALVFEGGIVWPDGTTATQKKLALETLEAQGLIARTD